MPRTVKKYQNGGKNEGDDISLLQKLANLYNFRENLAENINPYGYSTPASYNVMTGESTPAVTPIERLYNTI